ncbi:MAG: multicomponent Na+:H+ antiporter subunit D [Natronomonas sp.]|jgi:multicomponent Na+:H+ antiporter subunit D
MTEQLLPGLLIAVPILGAALPLALGLVRERIGWTVAAVVLSVEAALAGWLAYAVYAAGGHGRRGIVHVLGGERFGRKTVELADGSTTENFVVGIELVADEFSALIVALIAAVSLGVLAFARRAGPRGNAFYSGYLLLAGGLMGLVLTGDLFNLFVFLEIVGLSSYALIAGDQSAESAVASLKYLVIGTVGASMYLIGVGYLFVATGALNMLDVSRSLAGDPAWIGDALYTDPTVVAAFGFVAVGLATKAAIYPLHSWQPDAYAAAPDSVTIYISALVSTTAAYALARITWEVFTPAFFEASLNAQLMLNGLLVLAGASVLAGSFLAAMQRRVKRTFAYSSVAQFGLIVLGIGVAVHPSAGETAARFAVYGVAIHLLAHGLIKAGLFATAGALARSTGARRLSEFAGLAKRRPFLSGAMAVLGFGIVGVPPTVGFIGKWYLAVAAVESGLWPVIFVVFASTLLSLLYVARILEKLYFDYPPEEVPNHAEPSAAVVADGGRTLSVGMFLLAVSAAVLTLVLGFAGGELTGLVDPVVDRLFTDPGVVLDG